MTLEDKVKRWQHNKKAHAEWENFINSDAFQEGVETLKARMSPMYFAGESLRITGERQIFNSGFALALELVERIHKLHYVKVQEKFPEWGNLVDDEGQEITNPDE